MSEKKLIKNAIKCNHCGDVIESKYTHDFVTCSCETVSVDGGLSYCKRSFKNGLDDFEDLSEWEEIEEKQTEPIDYMIVSKPSHIVFECPYCHEDVEVKFENVDYKYDYWGDGAWVDCPECGKEVELGGYEYN